MATVQLVGLAVIAAFTVEDGPLVPLRCPPFLLLALWVAGRRMDNLATARTHTAAQLAAVRERDFWTMPVLYTGTFCSFIGFGSAFGPLLGSPHARSAVG